ncbi:MAG: FAD-dependent monooxygenase [Deltaproteobacteria bacterium]|nr:FAD-dependent monooxygenase [Deltaproteobacteria bacterium]
MTRRRVLIVGGGIGGLTLAGLLLRDGHEVTVLERAQVFAPVGAGIVLAPNATRVLAELDLVDDLHRGGFLPDTMCVLDQRGRELSRLDAAEAEHLFGGSVAVHRAVLHEALCRAAGGADIRCGTTVESVDDSGPQCTVVDSAGATHTPDLVVGADGIRSGVRELVFGGPEPSYSGYTCWRVIIEHDLHLRRTVEMWGSGRRFGIVPIASEHAYCFATANEPAGGRDPAEGALDTFRGRFADFGGDVPALLERLRGDEALLRNDIEEVEVPHWTRGRVALLGDAAHAMTPNMGQGAGMALEDALVLRRCLAESADVPAALTGYEALRRPRVHWVQTQSRRIGQIGQWANPLACWARDRLTALTPSAFASRTFVRLVDEAP